MYLGQRKGVGLPQALRIFPTDAGNVTSTMKNGDTYPSDFTLSQSDIRNTLCTFRAKRDFKSETRPI